VRIILTLMLVISISGMLDCKPSTGFESKDLFRIKFVYQPIDLLLPVIFLHFGKEQFFRITVITAAQTDLYGQ
jgi:uncharacterized membrane protein